MIDVNDVKIFTDIISAQLDERDKRLEQRLDGIEKGITSNANMILEELDNIQTRNQNHIKEIERNLDELKQYYRINRLENDNTSLVLQIIKNIQQEMEDIKKRIA